MEITGIDPYSVEFPEKKKLGKKTPWKKTMELITELHQKSLVKTERSITEKSF